MNSGLAGAGISRVYRFFECLLHFRRGVLLNVLGQHFLSLEAMAADQGVMGADRLTLAEQIPEDTLETAFDKGDLSVTSSTMQDEARNRIGD